MSVKDTSLKYNTLAMCLLCQGYALPWKLPDTVDAEDREDAIVAAVKRGHRMVIVSYRPSARGSISRLLTPCSGLRWPST